MDMDGLDVKGRRFIVRATSGDGVTVVSLKGFAFLCAVEAGMIHKLPDNSYDEAPFLRFWDDFTQAIHADREGDQDDLKNIAELLENEREELEKRP